MIEFQAVSGGYPDRKVLREISFSVAKGSLTALIGPNGCGKTTLFNALIGLITPTQGHIIFNGHDVTKMSANDRARMGIGRTYQVPRPFEKMTVYENILVAAVHGAGLSEKAARPKCVEALQLTGLYDKREVVSGTLTLLDRKRLEIARALGTQPILLLLDEVAAGLTEAEVVDVMKMVADLKAAGFSIIWIEHVIETMVNSTDHLMCMSDGTQLLIGDPLEVMNSKLVEEVYLGVEEDE